MDEATVIDISESTLRPPEPSRRRTGALSWAALGVAVVVLVAWLTARPAPVPEEQVPTRIPGTPLPVGLSLGTLVIPTTPPRLVQVGGHVGQQAIDGLRRPAREYSVSELGGDRFLVLAAGGHPLQILTPATGRATSIVPYADSAAPGADGASVVVWSRSGDRPDAFRYDLEGSQLGDHISTPPGRRPVGDTVAGLAYEASDAGGVEIYAGEQARYRSEHRIVAVGPARLVLAAPDGLVLVDLQDRAPYAGERRIPFPGGVLVPPDGGRLSVDGRYLAVDTVDREEQTHTVWVLDLATDEWRQLPGTPVRTGELHLLWNSHAGVLAVTTGIRDTVLWRPGDAQVYAAG